MNAVHTDAHSAHRQRCLQWLACQPMILSDSSRSCQWRVSACQSHGLRCMLWNARHHRHCHILHHNNSYSNLSIMSPFTTSLYGLDIIIYKFGLFCSLVTNMTKNNKQYFNNNSVKLSAYTGTELLSLSHNNRPAFNIKDNVCMPETWHGLCSSRR